MLGFTRGPVTKLSQSGALRVGDEPGWAKPNVAGLLLALVAVLVWVVAMKKQRRVASQTERGRDLWPRHRHDRRADLAVSAVLTAVPGVGPAVHRRTLVRPTYHPHRADRRRRCAATAWVAHRYPRFIGHRSGELLWIVN